MVIAGGSEVGVSLDEDSTSSFLLWFFPELSEGAIQGNSQPNPAAIIGKLRPAAAAKIRL